MSMSTRSGRLAQYKKTGLSYQSKKEVLKEEKYEEAKSKRNEKFMGRRAFLEVENISNPSEVKNSTSIPKQSTAAKSSK